MLFSILDKYPGVRSVFSARSLKVRVHFFRSNFILHEMSLCSMVFIAFLRVIEKCYFSLGPILGKENSKGYSTIPIVQIAVTKTTALLFVNFFSLQDIKNYSCQILGRCKDKMLSYREIFLICTVFFALITIVLSASEAICFSCNRAGCNLMSRSLSDLD